MPPVQLVTLAPGHFHAALVQKEVLPGVEPHVRVYAPLDGDLAAHLERLARFNTRADRPTAWTADIHAGPDWFDRFLRDRTGNVVVLAGRNRPKIDLILAAVSNGYCVLADKPWVVEADDFPKLERVFVDADRNGVLAWDIMTERWEATSRLQRELIADPEVFGSPVPGTPDQPALVLDSVHYLAKRVAGAPLIRPAWWFDPNAAGEAVADVGTHLADLAMWLAFPDKAIDYRTEIALLAAERWPTPVDRPSFQEITGRLHIPPELAHVRDGDGLAYWGNGSVLYRLCGRYVRITARWGVRADGPEGDTHLAVVRGSRAAVTVRHDTALGPGPQVFVTANDDRDRPALASRLEARCRDWNTRCPGYAVVDLGDRFLVRVPAAVRTGHESHFASVLGEFVSYRGDPSRVPAWERPNLLAKYHVTTHGVALARGGPRA